MYQQWNLVFRHKKCTDLNTDPMYPVSAADYDPTNSSRGP